MYLLEFSFGFQTVIFLYVLKTVLVQLCLSYQCLYKPYTRKDDGLETASTSCRVDGGEISVAIRVSFGSFCVGAARPCLPLDPVSLLPFFQKCRVK